MPPKGRCTAIIEQIDDGRLSLWPACCWQSWSGFAGFGSCEIEGEPNPGRDLRGSHDAHPGTAKGARAATREHLRDRRSFRWENARKSGKLSRRVPRAVPGSGKLSCRVPTVVPGGGKSSCRVPRDVPCSGKLSCQVPRELPTDGKLSCRVPRDVPANSKGINPRHIASPQRRARFSAAGTLLKFREGFCRRAKGLRRNFRASFERQDPCSGFRSSLASRPTSSSQKEDDLPPTRDVRGTKNVSCQRRKLFSAGK